MKQTKMIKFWKKKTMTWYCIRQWYEIERKDMKKGFCNEFITLRGNNGSDIITIELLSFTTKIILVNLDVSFYEQKKVGII